MIPTISALRAKVGASAAALKVAATTQRTLIRQALACGDTEEVRRLWGVLEGIRQARRALLRITKVVDDFPSAKDMLVGLSNDPSEVDRLDSPSFFLGRLASHASSVRILLALFDGGDPFE